MAENGKIDLKDVMKIINSKGKNAFSLKDESPTEVKDWISTGSTWLDFIIKKGGVAGIPVGKITEIAGESAAGKSFMAGIIASNAQKKGYIVVYFDSESAVDPDFLERIGVDLERFIYVQAESVESVYENIEKLMSNASESGIKYFFIHDSLANTATEADTEDEEMTAGPTSGWNKAKVLTKALKKLTLPLANGNHTLLILNQLKARISANKWDVLLEPFYTPGGSAPTYAYSLRIWLTRRKAKDAFVVDENGYRIGSEVKIKIKKSRFGSEGRECAFKMLFGDSNPRIADDESLLDVMRMSKDKFEATKGWVSVCGKKMRENDWMKELQNPKFKKQVLEVAEEVLVKKFANREGQASDHYDVDRTEEEKPSLDAREILKEARESDG